MSRWDETAAPRGDDYDARWAALEATGEGVHGEADFVASFAPATLLDAGCGTGRVAVELARRGVTTVGVDRDPAMLATARRKAPALAWIEHDLSTLDLRAADGPSTFDVVVAAGNVMIFLAPGTEAVVLQRLAAHLRPGGLLVAGFQLGGDRLDLPTYDRLAGDAGLALVERSATWDGEPYQGGDYAVSIHRLAAG